MCVCVHVSARAHLSLCPCTAPPTLCSIASALNWDSASVAQRCAPQKRLCQRCTARCAPQKRLCQRCTALQSTEPRDTSRVLQVLRSTELCDSPSVTQRRTPLDRATLPALCGAGPHSPCRRAQGPHNMRSHVQPQHALPPHAHLPALPTHAVCRGKAWRPTARC